MTRPAEPVPASELSRPPLSRGPKCARTASNIGGGSGAGRPAPLPLPVFPSCRPLSWTRQLLPMRDRGYCRDAGRPGAPSPPTPCKTIPYHWPLHELSASLHGYRVQLAENLSSALKEYFDPNSGRLQERLERRIPEVYPKSSMLRHRFQLGFGSGPAREPS